MSKGSSGGGAGVGGGSAASSGAGAATTASTAAGTHNINLPKDKKRLTIDQANAALKQMGYKRLSSEFDLKAKETVSQVRTPSGKTVSMNSKEIRKIVYDGAAK